MKNNTKGIGFKNFRRFEEFPQLEFGNITYMVGRNNSGKSTMVKALLLVIDYLQNQLSDTFSFDNKVLEDANIVTFGRAKCNIIDKPEIVFKLKLGNYNIAIHISGDDDRTKASVNVLHIQDEDIGYELIVNYNTERIHVVKKSISNNTIADTKEELEKLNAEINRLKEARENITSKGSKEALKLADILNNMVERRNKIVHANEPQEEVDNIEYDLEYSLNYQMEEVEEEVSEEEVEEEVSEEEEHFEELAEFDEEDVSTDDKNSNPRTEDNELKEIISLILYHNTIAYKKAIEKRDKQLNDEADDVSSGIIELDNTKDDLKDWIDELVATIENESFYYLGANPSKQSALFYLRDKNNALAQSIHEFKQLDIGESSIEGMFVKKWMREFEVGHSYKIDFYAGEAYQFHVLEDDGRVNHLSDKGMGSLQAMLLILRVASLVRINKKDKKTITLLVEEPELNLHPALQSKLTEFFHEVNKEFGFNFIVETHSEYMIRKSQVFTHIEEYGDKDSLNPNPFKTFYFPVDDSPYEMRYRKDGAFVDEFRKGFFDVSSDLAFDIL